MQGCKSFFVLRMTRLTEGIAFLQIRLPIQVGCFNVAVMIILRGGEHHQITRHKVIGFQFDHVAGDDLLPFDRDPAGGEAEDQY